jgi:hypothetical protein
MADSRLIDWILIDLKALHVVIFQRIHCGRKTIPVLRSIRAECCDGVAVNDRAHFTSPRAVGGHRGECLPQDERREITD